MVVAKHWRSFFIRLGIATGLLLAANLAVTFFWTPAWFTYWQVPVSCTLFICLLGVLLFDTFFQDRPR
jgi:hypothetical protein